MAIKRKEYMSIGLRNVAFAFFAPLGTLLFQWVVFKKDIFSGYFYYALLSLLLGLIFFAIGYIILDEEKK